MTSPSLILFRCLHCDHVRHRHCSKVCRLDPEHPDTPRTQAEEPADA